MRDPTALGELLLRLTNRRTPLSRTYDRDVALLERVPSWVGDLMSNDPAQHHTNQTPAPGGTHE